MSRSCFAYTAPTFWRFANIEAVALQDPLTEQWVLDGTCHITNYANACPLKLWWVTV